jgi:predicted ATPase
MEQALRAAIPQFTELQIYRDMYGIPHLRAKFEHWQSQGDWLTEADLSDGTLQLIGLLWALLDEAGPLIYEEPGLFLHQDIVFYIPSLLIYSRGRQTLVSTQNVDLLRDEGIAPNQVLILRPAENGTKVVVSGEIDTVRLLTEAGLPAAETTIPLTRPPRAMDLIYFRKAV